MNLQQCARVIEFQKIHLRREIDFLRKENQRLNKIIEGFRLATDMSIVNYTVEMAPIPSAPIPRAEAEPKRFRSDLETQRNTSKKTPVFTCKTLNKRQHICQIDENPISKSAKIHWSESDGPAISAPVKVNQKSDQELCNVPVLDCPSWATPAMHFKTKPQVMENEGNNRACWLARENTYSACRTLKFSTGKVESLPFSRPDHNAFNLPESSTTPRPQYAR
eukprot:GHVR01027124.1.p1 GENE.GHVR01027124.1~~GHVR01027124.1.p1  ORF type:complete len:221 (+),score=-5.92 GHVR01027124.1:872-1534(+)